MAGLYLIPEWFLGFDILLEICFTAITFIVSFYAFKVYGLSKQHQSKLFGIAFIFFSASYFIKSSVNLIILTKIAESVCNDINFRTISFLNYIGAYIYMVLFMVGLVTLAYMVLKIRSFKTYSLLLLTSVSSIIFSLNKISCFYFTSSLIMIFIVIHYFKNYFENKQLKTLLVLLAFSFLLIGNIHFIFSANYEMFYVIGHFFELIAYMLILTSLLLVLKNGKKKG